MPLNPSLIKRYLLKINRYDLLSFLSGGLLPLAFAPFYFAYIAVLSPAFLLLAWLTSSPINAFRYGICYGLGFFSVGISWVFISIHVFGGASIPVSGLITLVFISYLSLFIALQGYCFKRFFPTGNATACLFGFPLTWMFFEMLRGWLFTGFPWLFLGYSQSDTPLNGFAPIIGIYGLSFLTAFLSGLIVLFIQKKSLTYRLGLLILVCACFLVGNRLSAISWTHPIGKPKKITLIQGNIEQGLKWRPDQVVDNLRLYTSYTQKNWSSDIIIWPEAAITLPLAEAMPFINSLGQIAKNNNTTIISGVPIINSSAAYNSMIAIGDGKGIYKKRHLVPFGEYIPLKAMWQFVMQAFSIPMSNCQPGNPDQQPLIANKVSIGPYICYEIAYPLEFLSFLPKAELLLTITDDSWFGHSLAAEQHLQMAKFRALETGRYLMFVSNTGITAVINNRGQVTKSVPAFTEITLTTHVQPMTGTTPWIIFKTYPHALIIGLTLCYFAFVRWRKQVTHRLNKRFATV